MELARAQSKFLVSLTLMRCCATAWRTRTYQTLLGSVESVWVNAVVFSPHHSLAYESPIQTTCLDTVETYHSCFFLAEPRNNATGTNSRLSACHIPNNIMHNLLIYLTWKQRKNNGARKRAVFFERTQRSNLCTSLWPSAFFRLAEFFSSVSERHHVSCTQLFATHVLG